jgi:acyl transferase domain-containing protein/thioesterase domain-containing protein/acyl carrier protein
MKASKKDPGGNDNMEIAIVGIACRFPGAGNYEEYWSNLVQGRSSITEIPAERWPWQRYWGEQATEKRRSVSKWGGFITDIDAFDAGFFHISGREAQTMDPQQRIMMELAWNCLEDAGIPPIQLSDKKVGVFVGLSSMDYAELQQLDEQLNVEAHHSTGSAAVLVPNRVSHFLNLRGPSFTVDTACSSALYAVHLAAQSIQRGECRMALAGGINSLLNPIRYSYFSKTGMLSPTGSCKVFDESADGYVRGEGAGLVLLKPLKKALKDGDAIYGILKGSAVNHNGNTHTISAPGATAQTEVILAAMERAGITPDTISYVEAHGTGTPKGDPIEFASLTKAFDSYNHTERTRPYCHIGSVKANIGHLEAAAGIASLVKVLMAMKYRQLPMQLNFSKLNPGIDMKGTPFSIVQQLQEWTPPKDKKGAPLPRRAAINAFGFGGTNAHLLVEEPPAAAQRSQKTKPAALICLSAKTSPALRRKMEDLLRWLDKAHISCNITDISAALLTGREHFNIRFACVITSIQELKEVLQQAVAENTEGTDSRKKEAPVSLQQLQSYREAIKRLKKNKDPQTFAHGLHTLAGLYLDGYNTDWEDLFNRKKILPVKLPVYPFEKKKYWAFQGTTVAPETRAKEGHPLLHHDTSTASEQRYSSGFSGEEFFLRDHVIKGRPILPGVAYLEMAREAIARSTAASHGDKGAVVLRNIVWSRPFVVQHKNGQLHTGIYDNKGQLSYSIYQQDESGRKTVYSEGAAHFHPALTAPVHNLSALQASCTGGILSREQCYELFRQRGILYGPTFQVLEKIYLAGNTGDKVVARLSFQGEPPPGNNFVLHPALLDAATQAAIGLLASPGKNGNATPYVPFALNELLVYGPCTSAAWSIVSYSNESITDEKVRQLNIDVCNSDGSVCVQLKGLMLRAFEEDKPAVAAQDEPLLLFEPVWKDVPVAAVRPEGAGSEHLVILCGISHVNPAEISLAMEGARCVLLPPAPGHIAAQFNAYAQAVVEMIQQQAGNPGSRVSIQVVVNSEGEQEALAGLSGLMQVLHNEYPDAIGQLIGIPAGESVQSLAVKLKKNMQEPSRRHIRYVNNTRQVQEWQEWERSSLTAHLPWQAGGVYLITGGSGGLGLLFATEIARHCNKARIILTGRSALNSQKEEQLQRLRRLGAEASYRQADVSQESSVATLLEDILQNYGQLNGIIHAAGVLRDSFIVKKTKAEIQEVLDAKTTGLVNLDQAWGGRPLDFFLSFSSVAAVWGEAGQADYAMGNAFLDAYTQYRNKLVTAGTRKGKTIAINWPYWQEGGMTLTPGIIRHYKESRGIVPLETADGINAFYDIMRSGASQVMVVQGNAAKIKKLLSPVLATNGVPVPQPSQDAPPAADIGALLKQKVAELLQIDVQEIDEDTPLIEYGFDSILFTEFARKLGDAFNLELSPAVFFNYQTLQALAEYLSTRKAIPANDRPAAATNGVPVPQPSQDAPPAADTGALLKQKVAELLQIDVQEIDEDTPLIEYGFDSILFTEFARKLGDTFSLELSPAVFFNYQTLQALAEYLSTRKKAPVNERPAPTRSVVSFPELIQLNKGTQGRPVFWLHSGMGTVIMYNKLAQLTERPFFGIQPRGWISGHDPLRGIVEMATYYTHIITTVQPEGPYDLGGYSLGGTLAYEITRQLQEAGKEVSSVVMVDTLTGPLLGEFMVGGNHALLPLLNLLLHATIQYSPSGTAGLLIRSDEVNFEMEETVFIEQLLSLAKARGLESSVAELSAMLHRHVKVHLAFEPDKYAPAPLPDPSGFNGYFFNNSNGLLYGDLEPYYRPAVDRSQPVERYHHGEWKKYIPALKVIEVAAANHFTIMSEQRALNSILPVCEELYAGKETVLHRIQ